MIDLTRVKNASNGTPRFVAHFYELLSEAEQKEIHNTYVKNHNGSCIGVVNAQYIIAINKAKKIGGSKYRGKDFGGGIVFQSYNTSDLKESILMVKLGYNDSNIDYWRNPTKSEIKFGEGAIHHRTFNLSEVLKNDGSIKKWLIADDGLRYNNCVS